ncbi:hypothetical protein [Luteolibacter marinus]|uniref:hypothetical protein n=1 Tax=Luteolibacter marinus TaxID=2776705 RepID=UPI0018695E8A|nr:hypothetical protein [Luteolibacter marinus]
MFRRLLPLLLISSSLDAATVWAFGEPGITSVSFSKVAFSDWTLTENQDLVSTSVAITRQNLKGIYNANVDAGTQLLNGTAADVAGTLWAFEGLNGNPGSGSFGGAANHAALSFNNWGRAVEGSPPSSVGVPGVLYLVAEDVYLDIIFDGWGGAGSGGTFSYTRAAAVPEPAAALPWVAAAVLACRRRRIRR